VSFHRKALLENAYELNEDQNADRMMIRDPVGMMLELWPRPVLQRMGLL